MTFRENVVSDFDLNSSEISSLNIFCSPPALIGKNLIPNHLKHLFVESIPKVLVERDRVMCVSESKFRLESELNLNFLVSFW